MRLQRSKRTSGLRRWSGFVAVVGAMAMASGVRGANDDGYTMRDADATVQGQQQALEAELKAGHADAAAVRLDMMFRDHGAEMQQDDAGVLVNVGQLWIELGRATPELTQNYQKQFDGAVRKALEKVQADAHGGVAECMAVVRRYPLSSVVGDCIAEAARREARLGDWTGSLDLFAAARADGYKEQPADTLVAADLAAVKKQADAMYNGPVPFDATWYRGGVMANPRSFPTAVGGQVVVMGLDQVLTLRAGGTVGWSEALSQPPANDPQDAFSPYAPQPGLQRGGGGFNGGRQGGGFGGGGGAGANGLGPEVSAPGVGGGHDHGGRDLATRVTGYAGAMPAAAATTKPDTGAVSSGIIIYREADEDQNGNGWALTAVRTTDGQELWSTAGNVDKDIPPLYPDTSFFRSPVVDGRYVYDLTVDIGAQMGGVSVVALDIATGKMVWHTPVGSVSPQSGNVVAGGGILGNLLGGRGGRAGGRGFGGRSGQVQVLQNVSYNSGISVSGRHVVLTPDLGVAMCLDRFDGRLDWEEPTNAPLAADGLPNGVLRMNDSPFSPARYDGSGQVCGDAVVLAPQESAIVRGVSTMDGHMLWQNLELSDQTLIGGDATHAILAGSTITALDGATGKVAWTGAGKVGNAPPALPITGPSVVVGDQIQVPVSGNVIALSVATGESVKPDERVPRMSTWLKNDATLERMKDGKAAAAFDTSPEPVNPQPGIVEPPVPGGVRVVP